MKLTLDIDTLAADAAAQLQKAKALIEHLLGLAPTTGAAPKPPAAPLTAPAAPVGGALVGGIPATPPAPAPAALAGGLTHDEVKKQVAAWLQVPGHTAAAIQAIFAECGAPNVAKASPEQLVAISSKLAAAA